MKQDQDSYDSRTSGNSRMKFIVAGENVAGYIYICDSTLALPCGASQLL